MLNKKERWKTNLLLTIYGLIKPTIDFKPLIKPVERFLKQGNKKPLPRCLKRVIRQF